MAATVLAFPARGGNGFAVSPDTELERLDCANLVQLANKQEGLDLSKLRRSPEILLAMCLFDQLPPKRKSAILAQMDEAVRRTGDEAVKQLSAALATLPMRRR